MVNCKTVRAKNLSYVFKTYSDINKPDSSQVYIPVYKIKEKNILIVDFYLLGNRINKEKIYLPLTFDLETLFIDKNENIYPIYKVVDLGVKIITINGLPLLFNEHVKSSAIFDYLVRNT